MLIKQTIQFEMSGPGPPGRTCTLKLVIFMTRQKSLGRSSFGSLFTAKILQEALHLTSRYLGQIT